MAGGNRGRARRDLALLPELPVLSETEEDQESHGPEEWAQPVLALYKKALGVPWFIILFNSVYGASWAPGLVGIGRWIRASSLSRQTEFHREFLYDVTDGWRGCHG